MDTICVYKDKLNEALTLVPSMSQAKRLEAVSYWNNAATHFQKLVNANSPTRDESQELSGDATGLSSSLDYQQQTSDTNPTVIMNTEGFGPNVADEVDQSASHNCIMDINNDLASTNVVPDQYQRLAPLIDSTPYDTDYYSTNMIGGMQRQQQQPQPQLSPGSDEINPLPAMCNPTASRDSLNTIDVCLGNQQYHPSMQPVVPMDSLVSQTSSMSNIDNLNTINTQDDGLMFCPMLGGSMQTAPASTVTIGNTDLDQTGNQPHHAQVGPVVSVDGGDGNLVQCPRQTTAAPDISNGQFDRGPTLSARAQVPVGLSGTSTEMSLAFSDTLASHRCESSTHGARPLQQIQVFGSSSAGCNYSTDDRLSNSPPLQQQLQQQQVVYMPSSALGVAPSCSSGQLDITCHQVDSVIKQEAIEGASCTRPNNELHTCELCGKSGFSTKGNLKRHRKAHAGEKPYKCEHCESKFTEKKSLKIHLRRHTGEKPYKCTVCEKPFSQTGVLKSHMALHLEERKFNCDKCTKAFRQRSQLKLHLMRHDGIKKLECSRCMAKFLTKGDLERHFRIHTGERPYKCNMCEKTFTRQQSLNEHKNRHIGRKPFTCKICDKSFSEMSASYKHAKVHKKEEQAQQLKSG